MFQCLLVQEIPAREVLEPLKEYINIKSMNMGFSDFFKDSVNRTAEELVALYKLLLVQSAADGELTSEEAEVSAAVNK